jgi:hypothetical protein
MGAYSFTFPVGHMRKNFLKRAPVGNFGRSRELSPSSKRASLSVSFKAIWSGLAHFREFAGGFQTVAVAYENFGWLSRSEITLWATVLGLPMVSKPYGGYRRSPGRHNVLVKSGNYGKNWKFLVHSLFTLNFFEILDFLKISANSTIVGRLHYTTFRPICQ